MGINHVLAITIRPRKQSSSIIWFVRPVKPSKILITRNCSKFLEHMQGLPNSTNVA
ncbi:hypothetical protein JHK82_047784 [Glycine max]|nr:hypothetical protein JHK82_047784 [Glycine max]